MQNLKNLLRTAWSDWSEAWNTLTVFKMGGFPCNIENFMYLYMLAKRWVYLMAHPEAPGNPLDDGDYSTVRGDFVGNMFCYSQELCLRSDDVLAYYQALPDFSQAEPPTSPEDEMDRQILIEALWSVDDLYEKSRKFYPDLPDVGCILKEKHWPRPENETETQTA